VGIVVVEQRELRALPRGAVHRAEKTGRMR